MPNVFTHRAYLAWSMLAVAVAVVGTVLKVAGSPVWLLALLLAALVVCAEGIRRTAPEDKGQK
jgi:membrane protein implicated in regulation of membrane protease activity